MKKNSKFKGKVGFIIVGFAVILIVIGVVMAFLPKEDATSNSKSKSESEPTEEITNDSVELEKVHCLDSLCVENMNVSYDEGQGVGSIQFFIQNTGATTLPAGFIKVVFDNNAQNTFILRYSDFAPESIQSIEIEFTEKGITETTDYQLQYLTDEELQTVTSYQCFFDNVI